MAFGKKGAATLNDFGSYSSTEPGGAYDPRYDARTPGTDNAYRIKAGWKDGLQGVLTGAFGALMLGVAPELDSGMEQFFVGGVGLLFVLGALALLGMAATGKEKLIVDANGLHQSTFFGKASVSWSDLETFEVWTVNFNKMIFAKSAKRGMGLMKKQISIPAKAFKSREFELAEMVAKFRPDLFGFVPAVMASVGAKKLIPDLEAKFS